MKSFKSIREGNSVEPGVSEIDDVQDDPLSFVEIKPKKSKVVKEDLQEAVSVKKEKHSWGTMMTVHHGSSTSYPLHPEHQSAIKKLRPGMKTTFKDETNSTVHAHREGDTVHLTRPKTGSTLTSLPYHHFDTSEHAKPTDKKPAGEYDRKVTDHLKKKYNEEAIIEAHTEDDIANGGTVIYKHDGKHYMAKVSHKTGGGAATKIHTTSKLGHVVSLNHVVSTDASDWNRFKNIKEETEQMNELDKSTLSSYIKKASRSAADSANYAGFERERHGSDSKEDRPRTYGVAAKDATRRLKGIEGASNRLAGVKTLKDEGTRHIVHYKGANTSTFKDNAEKVADIGKSIKRKHADKVHSVSGSRETGNGYVELTHSSHAAAIKDHIKKAGGKVTREKTMAGGHYYNEENMVETKGAPKGFHFTKDGKLKRGDANQDGNGGTMLRADPLDKQRSKVPAVSEGVDFIKIWNNIKPVHEEVKTTHEDPLVLTKDAEGNIHTHANLSVANAIHGTDVKHQAIHTGKPVQAGKFTFELSKHHEGALKEDAPFDPVAHKKEHDRLMGKHIEAHKAVSKAFADMKAQGKSPRFDIPENDKLNDIKQEIATHNAKIPRGPAPAPGSAAHYYASKKPGEYTGD